MSFIIAENLSVEDFNSRAEIKNKNCSKRKVEQGGK